MNTRTGIYRPGRLAHSALFTLFWQVVRFRLLALCLLISKAKEYDINARFIELVGETNHYMLQCGDTRRGHRSESSPGTVAA